MPETNKEVDSKVRRFTLAKVKSKIDYAIISIREDEHTAVTEFFPVTGLTYGKRWYNLSHIRRRNKTNLLVATVRVSEQGGGAAQTVASDLLQDLEPRFLLVVGIAGGRPSDEFSLGDVIVSTKIHDFSVEAVLADGDREYNIAGGPLHPAADAIASNLVGFAQEFGDWSSRKILCKDRPPIRISDDRLEGSDRWRAKVSSALENLKSRSQPIVSACAIACSDRLVRDASLFELWLRFERHACAIEMESQGVYRAARGTVPFLAVRGISDIVGLKRDDPRWTTYACYTAAAFTRALVQADLAPRHGHSDAGTAQPQPKARLPRSKRSQPTASAPIESTTEIEFISLLEPDDVSIELMFQEFFLRASTVVEVAATKIALPADNDSQGWEKFRSAILEPPSIRINWPGCITQSLPKIERLIGEIRNHRDPRSLFNGRDPRVLAENLRQLERALKLAAEFMEGAPSRLPWLWLSLLRYSSPWPSSDSSVYKVQRNFLRFSSLKLYILLTGSLFHAGTEVEIPFPLTAESLHAPRWEHALSCCFDEFDEVVWAAVHSIVGVPNREVSIYGPKKLTMDALDQSVRGRPIISPWFMRYLVPQVEMHMAERSPNEMTEYSEEAMIRKIVDLNGDELDLKQR